MNELIVQTLTVTAIYALVTLSLNLQYGLTGLVNFGQSLLFAVGAFTVAIGHMHGWPVWLGIVLGPIVGAITGVLIAIPARRLGEHFWGLLTIGVAELFLAVMTNEKAIAGGTHGTRGIPPISAQQLLPILVVIIAVVIYGLERIRRSQFGRVIRTIREDQVLARAIGRDVFQFQAAVMAIGGAVAGLAGVAFAHWFTFISPDVFTMSVTLDVWAMMIIGGRANNYGTLFGAALLEGVFVGSRFLSVFSFIPGESWAILRAVLTGLSLVVVLMFRQQGVIPERKCRYAVDRQ